MGEQPNHAEHPMSEETLFHHALAITDPVQRSAFLDNACAGDAALRGAVEALLKAHAEPGHILDQASAESSATGTFPSSTVAAPSAETVGAHVGPYKLLQKLGEGGMGSVWIAEQTEPVKRRVALKLIKPGMDSAQIIRRFEAERQALALMDHSNIAKVLDAGATVTGRPYFAMELVKGLPITKYCDELHLSVRERLALFVPVCQAIQHAHQKGIIHRDVKPSNVLVTMEDGKPVPKVIDFGVAKALHQRLTEQTMVTEFGAMVGTLEYMSPEQAELSALDIDTRTDIYALGVLLYELLTGTTPLDRRRLRSAAYAEMLRLIKEQEPPRPSTRLTDSKDSLPSLAARRRTEPARLKKEVRGELDWIAMKCLEKDRTRRYETASALARDVVRYLQDEAVEACPPSAAYRFRKFLRKHRAGVLTAAGFAAVLLIGAGISIWQAVRATHAEAEARQNERQAKEAAEAEKKAKEAAEAQRKQAEAVASLLESMFTGLNPKADLNLKEELLRRLDVVAANLDKDYAGEPLVRARLREALGLTKRGLGEGRGAMVLHEQALAERERLLGPEHADTLESMHSLAAAMVAAGKLDRAVPLMETVLQKRKAKFGPDHDDTLAAANNLAVAYQAVGELNKALPLFEETLARRKTMHGVNHIDTLCSMNNLAEAYHAAGDVDRATPLLEETLTRRKTVLPPDHADTLQSMSNLAAAYFLIGRRDEALTLMEDTLGKSKAKYGPDHPDTLTAMNNLASAYQTVGKLDRSLPLFEETLRRRTARLGPDHTETLMSMNNLGEAYRIAGRPDKALPMLEETLEKRKAVSGPDHPETLETMHNLAMAWFTAGKPDRATQLFEQTLAKMKAHLPPDHPSTLTCMNNLGYAYQTTGQLDRAVPLYETALIKRKAKLPSGHPDTLLSLNNLALAYHATEKYDREEPLVRELLEMLRKKEGPQAPLTAGAMASLGLNLLSQKKYADAEPVLRECLTIREKIQPDGWTTFNTKSMLGGALLGQKMYADAEPLLKDGYEGMKQRESQIPAQARVRLTETLERLVQLYEALDQKDEAAKWRKELEARKGESKDR
jgi:serine/threonine protein kinase/Tfp pilus assembly protein PilF